MFGVLVFKPKITTAHGYLTTEIKTMMDYGKNYVHDAIRHNIQKKLS